MLNLCTEASMDETLHVHFGPNFIEVISTNMKTAHQMMSRLDQCIREVVISVMEKTMGRGVFWKINSDVEFFFFFFHFDQGFGKRNSCQAYGHFILCSLYV